VRPRRLGEFAPRPARFARGDLKPEGDSETENDRVWARMQSSSLLAPVQRLQIAEETRVVDFLSTTKATGQSARGRATVHLDRGAVSIYHTATASFDPILDRRNALPLEKSDP
jgi:hypothetical protein